ncbi:ABC transporter permease [Lichenifustis flavocetrariae]|uniref:ABC transporter permease n=1 Tax=Lichenifustis flavocetrariae TaxID=2949735 RepID=A0AA41YWM1_9HYPH|nr:ABC transporter permease [Lichenifustis flavocetrariae]MCW6508606.1 ABC transporter permease [Lichenifustis flavocetrariae]
MGFILLRRLGEMLFVMAGISVLVFLIFFVTPGADPAARIAGRNASPEVLAAVRHDFGFDQPIWVQYLLLMKRLFITGDLTSFVNRGQKVIPSILEALPITFSLLLGAAVLWVVVSILIGVTAAMMRGTWVDKTLMVLGLIGVSMPVFWVGEVANLITQSRYHDTWLFSWVPALGYVPLTQDPWGWFKALVVPWITLAILYIGLYGRVLRASLVEAYQEDFIRTARAKGLSERRILIRHALRTSLVTFVSLFGLDFGALVGGGTLLVEYVFGLQGVGFLTFNAFGNLDLPMIMAAVMYASVFVVGANAVVDILYATLDPRVRTSRA